MRIIQKHGLRYTPEYPVWAAMKQRCLNPNDLRYADYGGRGITVCDDWLTFQGFIKDMGFRPGKSYSLDRIDNDGNYEASNCRWATRIVQEYNKRPNPRNLSGHVGVTQYNGQYIARITVRGRNITIGKYPTMEEAVQAYESTKASLIAEALS